MIRTERWRALAALGGLLLVAVPATAATSWPEIPAVEKALKEVPGFPEAPAVVLLRQGFLSIDPQARSSSLEVYTRIKILTEEGRDYANGSLSASSFFRVKNLEGRTHLPDGRIVELAGDAKFVEEYSIFYKRRVHTFAMPEVQVGSIVEFRYITYFDTVLLAEPWYFQAAIPVLRSEVTLDKPTNFGFRPYPLLPPGQELETSTGKGAKSVRLTYALNDLPPIPDEEARYPFEDLSSQIVFLPTEAILSGREVKLLNDWPRVVELFQGSGDRGSYTGFRRQGRAARNKGKALAGGLAEPRAKAEAAYRFVRDEIQLKPLIGVEPGQRSADAVLDDRRGDYAEKALLLQVVLEGAGIDSSIAWANPRDEGRVNPTIPNPYQFNRVLVAAVIGGQRVFLDPSDRDLAFGALPPQLEGVSALLVDTKQPEWVTLPTSTAADSVRNALVELAVAADGSISGKGSLELTGHHAWRHLDSTRSAEDTAEHWREWLETRFSGYRVDGVEVQEDREARRVEVRWQLALRPEEVLDDEVTVRPAAPLAVTANPFSLSPERRRSPVLLSFADSDRLELHLSWPEGWSLDAKPRLANLRNGIGQMVTDIETDPGQRTLVLRRRMDVNAKDLPDPSGYGQLYALYQLAERSDAESLALVRE